MVSPESARNINQKCKERAKDPLTGLIRLDLYFLCLEEETTKSSGK